HLKPGSFYEASYGGLGMGLGTALGVKHALRERPVILTIGDGSFYYNAVPAAFGCCQEHDLPLLVVLFDNAGYFSQKNDVVREYPDGHPVRTNQFTGPSITPRPPPPMPPPPPPGPPAPPAAPTAARAPPSRHPPTHSHAP